MNNQWATGGKAEPIDFAMMKKAQFGNRGSMWTKYSDSLDLLDNLGVYYELK